MGIRAPRSEASKVAKQAFRRQLIGKIKAAEKRKGSPLTVSEKNDILEWIKKKIRKPKRRRDGSLI